MSGKASMTPGKRFEDKFRKSAERCGCLVIRIPDKVLYKGGYRVSEPTEADFVIATRDNAHLVECKAVNRPRLEFYNVKEHQERSLADFDGMGDHLHSWLAVEFRDKDSYRKGRRMFMLPVADWLAFKETTGRKSAPLSFFERSAVECPQEGAFYDLRGWL